MNCAQQREFVHVVFIARGLCAEPRTLIFYRPGLSYNIVESGFRLDALYLYRD